MSGSVFDQQAVDFKDDGLTRVKFRENMEELQTIYSKYINKKEILTMIDELGLLSVQIYNEKKNLGWNEQDALKHQELYLESQYEMTKWFYRQRSQSEQAARVLLMDE